MPTKETFICSSTGTFLRLFPEQEFLWSKQGFLHFPVPIFRLAGAEPFPWHRTPSAVPCPVLGSSCCLGWVCSDGWNQVPDAQRKTLPQTSAACPSSALQEIRAGHLLSEEQDLPSSEGIPIPHSLCNNECLKGTEGNARKNRLQGGRAGRTLHPG